MSTVVKVLQQIQKKREQNDDLITEVTRNIIIFKRVEPTDY